MKTVKIVVLALITTILLPSCIRFVPQGQGGIRPMGYPQQMGYQPSQQQPGQLSQPQRGVRKLDSITVTKRQTGYCQARIWQGPANTPQNVQRVAEYASSVYERTGHIPSEQTLSSKFGFRAQARWIDTPDRVVGQVTVRPDEVPANIRARFQ